jgi:mRNA interferase RelE/StbE
MASFDVILKPAVEKDLRSLSRPVLLRVMRAIENLSDEPFTRRSVKLEGSGHLFRIRVGDYRIIYELDRDAKRVIIHCPPSTRGI